MLKEINRLAESIPEGLGITSLELETLNKKVEVYIENITNKVVESKEDTTALNRLDILGDLSEQFNLEEVLLLASSTIVQGIQAVVHEKMMEQASNMFKSILDNISTMEEPKEETGTLEEAPLHPEDAD